MRQWWIRTLAMASVMVLCVSAGSAWAQANRGRLIVTVTDMTGAVLPNATVVVTGIESPTRAATVPPAQADAGGLATLANLVPGRYAIEASFPAFDTTLLKDVRIRAGDNRQTVVLKLSGFSDSVSVGRDREEAASDRASAFGSALTREQIDALPDDETEMANQLRAIGGPDAVIRVDTFEGQQLPPKSQIKSIRITRDQFAAENHYAGGISIDIVTQPGIGPLRSNIRTGFYNSALDGDNELINQRTPSQYNAYGGGISGTLIKNKSSFSLNVNGQNQFQVPVAYAWVNGVKIAQNLGLHQPSKFWSMSGIVDYALTKDQTLRAGYSQSGQKAENLGVGGFNFDPRSGYTRKSSNSSFRIQESGPLGRRFFTTSRLLFGTGDTDSFSLLEEPTVIVLNSATAGGAQQSGGPRTRSLLVGSDLDYIRGRHSVRMGVQIEGTGYRTDQQSNYLGTYTFLGLGPAEGGTPVSFTQRIGDPNIDYWNLQTGVYVQDDIKLRKNLTLTPGLRYEVQSHVPDHVNPGPRVGVTWAPFKNGQTTFRGSAGIFYDWLSTGTYEQTLRFDGFRQQEVNISNPTFPIDPSLVTSANAPPTNRYLLSDDLIMGRTTRFSGGVSQTIKKKVTLSATYTDTKGVGLLVGRNLNVPVDGVRPDARFANVIEADPDGSSRQRNVSVDSSLNLSRTGGGPPAAGGGKLFDWRRNLYVSGYYTYGRFENDTDGAFTPPPTGDLSLEWGSAGGDIRHRTRFSMSSSAIRSLNMQFGVSTSSAPPLNILLGKDTNGDLIFNDRPDGFGRNTYRTTGQWNIDGYFSYSFGLGRQQTMQTGGVSIQSINGVLTANALGAQSVPRYRINISCDIRNLTNHGNLIGYGNVISATESFLQPTAVAGVRRITFNMGVQF